MPCGMDSYWRAHRNVGRRLAASFAESGCIGEPCHVRAIENRGIAISAIIGGLLGGGIGASIGKLSHHH